MLRVLVLAEPVPVEGMVVPASDLSASDCDYHTVAAEIYPEYEARLQAMRALDFDDLTGKGLAFDTLRGNFRLTDGDVYTDNLTLRGSAAEIGLAGHTNLRNRTYDQTAVVTGQLGASLGVAGALAGGPVIGAALLLFSQVFKEPLKGVTRGYYHITGSWDDPQVRRIDARELKDERQTSEGSR